MLTLYDKNGNAKEIVENKDIVLGTNYVKFPNGLAIVWGRVVADAGKDSGRFNLPFPVYNYTITATHSWAVASQGKVTIGNTTETYANILIYDFENDTTNTRNANVIVVGKWKQ